MRERSELILADLIAIRAEQNPDLDVLTFEHLSLDGGQTDDEVRTYADLHSNANRIAAELVIRGMQRGDRFALMMRNLPEFVETMIAASVTATVFVPVDPRSRGAKLEYQLRNAGCKGVVCDSSALDAITAVRANTHIEWVVVVDVDNPKSEVDPLGSVLSGEPATVDVRIECDSDPLQIIYTSGTTGDPKGVVFPNIKFGAYTMLGWVAGYQVDDRPYTGLSLTHGNAQAVTLGPSLGMGLRAVFSRKFTKSRLWDVCRLHGCTVFSLLGGMATSIYSEPSRPDDADNPVRFVTSAGMPAAIWEPFERRFDVKILEWYAAIEGGMAIKPIGEGPIGSFGRPLPGLEMKVLDDDDHECQPGTVGELCSRPTDGPADPVEYFDNPDASAAKTRGGWLRSGDMVHADSEGWLFFDHRRGGGLRHNGDFISPGIVEKVIAEHPMIDDVFVYGVPAASGAPGERDVVAAVVLARGAEPDWAHMFRWCAAGLEPNFIPSWFQVVDEIPKTSSEKPQERFLVDAFSPEYDTVISQPGA